MSGVEDIGRASDGAWSRVPDVHTGPQPGSLVFGKPCLDPEMDYAVQPGGREVLSVELAGPTWSESASPVVTVPDRPGEDRRVGGGERGTIFCSWSQ